MNTRTVFILAGAAVLFLAGWDASDIVTDIDGEPRVVIETDPLGNGHLTIKGVQGLRGFQGAGV